MAATQRQETYSVRRFFAGKSILVTGATGFLAKVLVEKILWELPEVEKVFLLIRPRTRPDGSRVAPRERLRKEVLRSGVFARLRERQGERFEAWCGGKIECVAGDLTHPRLGLDEAAYARLAEEVQVVIGSAATVVFDERLDVALDINTLSPTRLLELAAAAGASYAHISTAYVSGRRGGRIPERLLPPLEAINAQLPPGQARPEKFDVEKEIERLRRLCDIIRADCETQQHKHGWAPESEEARSALRRALVSGGMNRARSLGWNDTYTYTKFLGEQLVQARHGSIPTVILRPSIIESSLRDPEPGWLDGLRMADPLIVGFGKGRLKDFPASRRLVLDLIPADLVVNAVLASLAHLNDDKGRFELLHVASGSENPLVFEQLYQAVRDYFQKHPFLDRSGKPVGVPHWKFPTVERFKRHVRYGYLKPVQVASALMGGPVHVPGTRRLRARLRQLHNAMEQLLYYVDIYSPYTNLDCRFETGRAREIFERMAPEERAIFGFDPKKIRWRHYIQDVHIPGLKRNILRMETPPRAGAGEGHLLDEEAAKTKTRLAAAVHGVPQTIVELAARGAERFGGKRFLAIARHGATVDLSYRDYFVRAGEWARVLRARLGLQGGERVVLWGANGPEWALAYLAIVRAGAAAVPLDRQMPASEAAGLTRRVDAKAVIVSPEVLASAGDIFGPRAGLPVCLNPLDDLALYPGGAWPYPQASLGERPLKWPAPETLASILFTSGTTLAPKGVMLSHANFLANALAVAEVLEPMESDRFLSVLPLHHAFEFTGGLLTPMFGGSTIHYLEALRGPEVLKAMKREGITVVLGVPRLFQLFADGIRARIEQTGAKGKVLLKMMQGVADAAEMVGGEKTRRKLFAKIHEGFGGQLRLFVSGGAALDPELFHFFRRFGIVIAEGYGLTETAPILTVNPLGAPKPGRAGLSLPGLELKIKQPDRHGIGEILARGPSIMQGYWKDPEATERAFEHGWFRTGDLGRFDAQGYLHLTGRLKDVIVTPAGKNVYPDEIEPRFHALPQVKECCVLGLPARRGHGDEVALVVVPEGGAGRKQIEARIEQISNGLPPHARIARILFQEEELPKTGTLKVQRNRVHERYAKLNAAGAAGAAGAAAQRSAPKIPPLKAGGDGPGDLFEEVTRAISEVVPAAAGGITRESKLQLDLGLDSIGRVDLIGKLELRLNAVISEEALAKLFTVDDVIEAFAEASRRARESSAKPPAVLAEWPLSAGAARPGGAVNLAPSLTKSVLQGAFSTSAKVFFNTYLHIDAYGREHLPQHGAYILASNHSSHLDTAAIREVLGARAASLHVMGAKDYFFDTRLKSWFFSTLFNALPFEREEATLEGLSLCRRVLEGGQALLIFPEGTRSITGKLQPFKGGIGLLALELDYPVLPVHVHGTYAALPKGRTLPRPSRVTVRIGPPLDFSELRRKKARKNREKSAASGPAPRGKSQLYRQAAECIRAGVEALSNAPPA